jgi:ribosome-associated protein
MIFINKDISIDEKEIKMDFIRASGPGGQNVNKVSTAVQLRFDVFNSKSLNDKLRQRLIRLAKNKINEDGILIIDARRFRTQIKNRQDAIDRLVELIRKATIEPKKRVKTKQSKASKKRILENKRRRSKTKQLRKPVRHDKE